MDGVFSLIIRIHGDMENTQQADQVPYVYQELYVGILYNK